MANKPDKIFLDLYFKSVYDKLEADALLFNRELPHEGLKGSENEQALADILKSFLPPRYGVESNVLIIDRNGSVSRQCDIVVYNAEKFPRYFRKVYPIEIVYAIVEVKTSLTKQQVDIALENEAALRALEFYPMLTNYWQTKTKTDSISHVPPVHCIFGYRSETKNFGTFISWFDKLPSCSKQKDSLQQGASFNHFIASSLDKGIVYCRGDSHVPRWLAIAEEKDNERNFPVIADGQNLEVDPAKTLLFFLETLWTMVEQSPRHPGFDIRSYMNRDLSSYIPFDSEGKFEKND